MTIQISKRAQREVERISKYWHEHADHPKLFEQELLEKLEDLLVMPSLGVQYRLETKPGLMRSPAAEERISRVLQS